MKLVRIATSIALILSCVGCSSVTEEKSVDEAFVSDLKDGLLARWEISDTTFDDSKESWDKLVNAELAEISKYKDKKFENEELGVQAKSYIKSLEDTLEITKYVTDYDKWYTEYEEGIYKERNLALYNIDKISDVEFSTEEDQDSFDVLVEQGKETCQVQELIDSVESQSTVDEYGDAEFTATVTNSTDFDFDYFCYEIQFVNGEGVVTNNEIAPTDNWESGSTHQFTFTTYYSIEGLTLEVVAANYSI